MKEKPILFNGKMVRAILDGRKTQTRRVIKNTANLAIAFKPYPADFNSDISNHTPFDGAIPRKCPQGKPGDQLWVRETWNTKDQFKGLKIPKFKEDVIYRIDGGGWSPWKPSIFMPRWASRISLEIIDVRVEKLQSISNEDSYKEGVTLDHPSMAQYPGEYKSAFEKLWDSINGKDKDKSWKANPWVWCITFKVVK